MSMPPPGRRSKIGPVSLNRNIAQAPSPSDQVGTGENRIQVSTYFTKALGTDLLYAGDRIWTRVRLVLLTAGPVAVGQFNDITPVLSGKGLLLVTGQPVSFDIAKGNRLFIAAQSVNRVSVSIEPYPWLETITGLLGALVSRVASAPSALAGLVSGKPNKIG